MWDNLWQKGWRQRRIDYKFVGENRIGLVRRMRGSTERKGKNNVRTWVLCRCLYHREYLCIIENWGSAFLSDSGVYLLFPKIKFTNFANFFCSAKYKIMNDLNSHNVVLNKECSAQDMTRALLAQITDSSGHVNREDNLHVTNKFVFQPLYIWRSIGMKGRNMSYRFL